MPVIASIATSTRETLSGSACIRLWVRQRQMPTPVRVSPGRAVVGIGQWIYRRACHPILCRAVIVSGVNLEPRGTAHHYEVLGRLMVALFDSGAPGILEGAQHFRFWETMQGGFCLTWDRGSHADEVANELLEVAADDDRTHVLRPGDVVFIHNGVVDPRLHTTVDIQNVRMLLRPHDTIGREAALVEAFAAVSAT
ncbi:hypothetical protein [Kibdelosporangium aridum]|uniref:Uncharacterized protein n=1 Tax=Kibdelosporangium aridum TaxID=2030 RepID=A0A1W2EYW4_KIBAR|nr:hypothetical protein [Kibdelosporangium aridum]SMD14772.1 hypothetical protein SAMN05661093_05118 [Kibdelosporangium aridum]